MAEIRLLNLEDLTAYIDHLSRHYGEPGINGAIAQPHSLLEFNDCEKYRANIAKRWSLPLATLGWGRVWGLIDGHFIVGHLELTQASSPYRSHRIHLGMGIEQNYRSQGYGKALLTEAFEWLQRSPAIEWVELKVFAHNHAAISLYKQFGFKELGLIPDQLRIDEQSIDELLMARPLSH